jgi:hypothetical protein
MPRSVSVALARLAMSSSVSPCPDGPVLVDAVAQMNHSEKREGERLVGHDPDVQRERQNMRPGNGAVAAGSETADPAVFANGWCIRTHARDPGFQFRNIGGRWATALS